MLCYFGSSKLCLLQITVGYEHSASVCKRITMACLQLATNTFKVRIIPVEIQSVSSFLSSDLFLPANVRLNYTAIKLILHRLLGILLEETWTY